MNKVEENVFQVIEKIENKVSVPQKGNNWINLSDLGAQLRNNGIDYNMLGYDKLTSFLSSIEGLELYRDERNALPVIYVRTKTKSIDKKASSKPMPSQKQITPNQALMNWAFMGYIPDTMHKLKEMALEENWGKIINEKGEEVYPKNEKGEDCYPILVSYLTYTFYKQQKDKKIFYSESGEYAVFNTGLVDDRYKQIYALFKENKDPNKMQKWYLVDFCIEGEDRAGKTLVSEFDPMPPAAHYFNKVTDLLYDTRKGEPQLDIQHIIIENVERLPLEFIKANAPQNFDVLNPNCMSGEEKQLYFDRLRQAIENDPSSYRQMTKRLEDALSISIERVKWNFKSAIPMYYPVKDEMCLFLPLCLVKDNKVDVALVVEKQPKSGRYLGVTIYELNWAYKCARLVCRPDSDWLTASTSQRKMDEIDE